MNDITPARRRLARPRLKAIGIGTLVLGAALAGSMSVATAASNISPDGGPIDILLGVGADQSQRNVSWYFPSNVDQALELEPSSQLAQDGTFTPAGTTVVPATKATNGASDTTASDSDTKSITGVANQSGYINAHATITGLAPSTTYSYHVGDAAGGHWSTTYSFTTPSAANNFVFDFFGDPQVGSSGHPDDDGAGWAATLDYATSDAQGAKPELLVSGGDQIEHANNEYEWSQFADSSTVLKRYPWAATIGNHDAGGKGYEQHNSLPNSLNTPDFYPGGATATTSGGDYWYIYKDVLFIDINSNAYAGGSDAEHVEYVRDVIGRQGGNAKWTVLVYHHSIYSPADHANDSDNQQRRFDFTRAFSKLGVDLVLQGHDHSYSRSYALLNSGKTAGKANPAEKPAQAEIFPGPGGVIYVTANSSSGSKYYDLTTPTGAGGYGADTQFPTPNNVGQPRHFTNSVENQEHVRTYIRVGVTDNKLNVTDVRSGDCTGPNAAVTYGTVGQKWCGKPSNTFTPADGTTPGTLPGNAPGDLGGVVGSAVDRFGLNRFVAPSAVAVTGTPRVGQKLAARSTGEYSAGTKVVYSWKANGVAFAGNTSTITLTPAQFGKRISVTVTGTLLNYPAESVTSAATTAVTAAPLSAGKPSITGTARVGRTLTGHPGAVRTGSATVGGATLRYQWYVGATKSRALTTSRTYLVPAWAKGQRITVVVTASKAGYSTVNSPRSTATAKVAKK